jgi:asparagine synthase (glutamine-hydrolysing)
MCGIAGLVNQDTSETEIWPILQRMCSAITHRGPDDDGFFVSHAIGLGMRRLSIIDVHGGKQPIHNEDATVQIVYNGEIYNYQELKQTLKSLGHVFYTHSDTEVIVHAYEEYGADCLRKLRGMFSFALWDACHQVLFLAIDRLGIKPLYYALSDQGIVFGSDLICVLKSGQVAREFDYQALAQYGTLGYIPAPLTIFRKIQKLMPGHYLVWSLSGDVRIEPYWDYPTDVARHDRVASLTRTELREKLRDAVRSHLISDVPLGAFLSGGIDSSVVVALMSEISPDPVKTFSIGFAEKEFNELDKARIIAQRFHTDHHELIVEPETVEVLPDIVQFLGEPFADPSVLPTYYVSKMARQHVKVVLSGDGGDELFVGYNYFRGIELARLAQKIPAPVREFLTLSVESLPAMGPSAWRDRIALFKKRVRDSFSSPREAFLSKNSIRAPQKFYRFLSADVREEICYESPYSVFDENLRAYPDKRSHPLEPFLYTCLKVQLAADMLVKVDRMSMANSLEVRVPLLDSELVEYVATIPVKQRFSGWRLKGLLRDTMSDLLPPEILNQSKRGFAVPLASWFRGNIAGFAADILLSREASESGFVDRKAVEATLSKHRQGRDNLGAEIWSLLIFELWRQRVMS